MTDKEKILAEIKRRMNNRAKTLIDGSYWDYKGLIDFIDSLKEKPLSEDLEQAAYKYGEELDQIVGSYDDDDSSVGDYAQEAFKAGARWQKEQMMKDAVECEVDKDYYIKFSDETWIDLDPSMQLKPAFGLNKGDKVKIIVLKEE